MNSIRILLADDHTLTRAGVRMLVESMGATVLEEVQTGRDAVARATKLQPDIVLMDISMPVLNGIEATTQLSKEAPSVRVIILSTHSDEEHVLAALQAGAAGYLLKSSATAELEIAIQSVARGDTYLSPAISRHVISRSIAPSTDRPANILEPLTPRQREILQLVAEGKSTKEIAFLLNISIKTVETHRAQLMERLDIHDIPGLVRYAMRAGLISA